MRVIAGTSRGRKLADFTGHNVRPTPDRVREAMFSILTSRLGGLSGLRVLDLFAGSGALAIEALSRGAASAHLVDKDPASARIIRENIERCHFSARSSLHNSDAVTAINSFAAASFDLIFVDPPYGQGLAEQALLAIDRGGLITRDGTVCVETDSEEAIPETIGSLQRFDQRRYGSTMVHFYA